MLPKNWPPKSNIAWPWNASAKRNNNTELLNSKLTAPASTPSNDILNKSLKASCESTKPASKPLASSVSPRPFAKSEKPLQVSSTCDLQSPYSTSTSSSNKPAHCPALRPAATNSSHCCKN